MNKNHVKCKQILILISRKGFPIKYFRSTCALSLKISERGKINICERNADMSDGRQSDKIIPSRELHFQNININVTELSVNFKL